MLWPDPALKGPLSRALAIIVAEAPEGRTGTGEAAATTWISAGCSAMSSWMPARGAEIFATSPTCTTTKLAEW